MELQSVLLPDKRICGDEEMYFHRDGDWLLFNGYFNLFYLEKHHKYCDIDELTLELEVKGFRKLVVMHGDLEVHTEVLESAPITGRERIRAFKENRELVQEDAAGQLQRVSIKLPYKLCKQGVLWFKVQVDPRFMEKEPEEDLRKITIGYPWTLRGYYRGYSEKSSDVSIGVNICTYKREAYVTRNMQSLLNWIENRRRFGVKLYDRECRDGKASGIPEVAGKLHVFIVDNGQTLLSNEEFLSMLSDAREVLDISVIPNANTGGCGGFTRGMREAMTKRDEIGLTHLLMMDDDAVFDPDLFIRLYGFLAFLRPEFKEITVGGALLREDYRYIQHAAGEWFTDFKVVNDHLMVDMRDYKNCVAEWMTGTEREHKLYGAWWCCLYNMNAICEENIPLPLFVHQDDIQFGIKQRERGIVFLNGVCVWHQGFEMVFPGVKQYYNMRNTLITMNIFEPEILHRKFRKWSIRRYIGMLISCRYADCYLIERGFEDYRKGRQWLIDSDPEAIHKELMERYSSLCNMKPLAELGLSEEELANVVRQIDGQFGRNNDEGDEKRLLNLLRNYYDSNRFTGTRLKKVTFNGWLLPAKRGIKVITPLDSPWNAYRYKRVLLYEPGSGKGVVVMRSFRELFRGIRVVTRFLTASV